MSGEHPSAVGIDLALPDDTHPRSLEAKVETSDAREERSDRKDTSHDPREAASAAR